MKNPYLLLLFLFLSCTPPLPEEGDSQLSECNAPYGYDCGDIAVLKSFIEINSQIFRHYLDYNKNDVIEPLEFGYQVWDKGRLIRLDLSYSLYENIIMKPDNPAELDLTNYRLTKIPSNIGELTELGGLFLHNNELDSIPQSVGNLTQLKILDLESNLLTELPDEIGKLLNLERLVLGYNQLISLPASIGNLTSLEKLWLQHNQLGSLPESLGNLIKLEWLYLNNNLLTELPDEIGNLVNLKLLNIENNMISSIPESMCIEVFNNITMYEGLETFSIGGNKFCDNDDDGALEGIPACIEEDYDNQNCANCQPWEFNIEGYCADSSDYNILQNFLDLNPMSMEEGLIPMHAYGADNPHWWDEGRLIEISFSHKQLTSNIPENIGDLEKLEILRLTGNELKGEIPNNITNLNNLSILKLNSNDLNGSIPDDIGNLINLDTLCLNNNTLGCYEYDYECDPFGRQPNCCIEHCNHTDMCNAEFPEGITNLDGLQYLKLNHNMLSGIIPYNIGDMYNLKYLHLDNNFIFGEIPSSIGNLTKLRRLYLLNNDLEGEVTDSICTIYSINENFRSYLHNNNLCPDTFGYYPECIPESHLGLQSCAP